jgi:hypothetical protein
MEPTRQPLEIRGSSLADLVERVLDKGLIINADIAVSVAGVELLGIKIRAAIASFETAAQYGLEFPSGTNLKAPAWEAARLPKEYCPQCAKRVLQEALQEDGCPWCGWAALKSPLAAR